MRDGHDVECVETTDEGAQRRGFGVTHEGAGGDAARMLAQRERAEVARQPHELAEVEVRVRDGGRSGAR